MASSPSPDGSSSETIVELGRMGALSDGVFAVAITLLVLDIRLPDDVTTANLAAGFVSVAPKLLVYFISFIVIGGAWGTHQRMLSQIKRGDGPLVWFNLLSLLFITFVPASSAMLGRFPGELIAISSFALNVILIQLSALWLWRHASKNGLLIPVLDPRVIEGISRRFVLSGTAFGFSILLALLSPTLVYIIWIGLFVLIFATDWLSWQQAFKTVPQNTPLDGAARAHIVIRYGAGQLHVHPGTAQDMLMQGTFGGGLDFRTKRDGDTLNIEMNAVQKRGIMSYRYPWAWGAANALDWNVALNAEIPLTIVLTGGAGEADLDLTGMNVTDMRFATNASSITIHLPAHAGLTSLKIEGSTTSFFIHVPQNVAAQIHMVKAVSGLEVDPQRFVMIENGIRYRSADYDTAANRVDIQSELSFGSIQIF